MRALRHRLIGDGGWVALEALLGTVSFEVRGEDRRERLERAGEAPIYVLWHGRLLPSVYYHRGREITALVSRSEDGEYIARLLRRWGYRTVRGSSSRGGGSALRRMVREGRAGRALAFTPDGPRGPRERMKPGVLAAARLTGQPVLPLAAGADRAWWFGSWDRFLVPKPFARVRLAYGEPRRVARDADASALDRASHALEEALRGLVREVDPEAAER